MKLKFLVGLLAVGIVSGFPLSVEAQDEVPQDGQEMPVEAPVPVEGEGVEGETPDGATPPQPVPPAVAGIFVAEPGTLAQLPRELPRRGAVSLRVSRAALEANASVATPLVNWVRGGGVIFLHTDAAQLFGYETIEARAGANQSAGQLFGRARAALPFNAHPLLSANNAPTGPAPADSRLLTDPTRFPGVNVVFYEMAAGDHLVTGHPAATPLLEVTDLARDNGGNPLYAAAIAPFGAGLAVFTPDVIDGRRADGQLFLANLQRLLPSTTRVKQFVGVSASAITQASDGTNVNPLIQQLRAIGGSSPALPPLGAVAPGAPAQPTVQAADEPQVLLDAAEGAGLAALISGNDAGRRTAAVQLLRARLEWQRGDGAAASSRLQMAEQGAAGAAELAFWRGCLWAHSAQDLEKPSPERAAAIGEALNSWTAAQAAPRLLPAAPATPGVPPRPLVPTSWVAQLQRAATMFAAEPPLVRRIGTGEGSIILRTFADDENLGVTLDALNALSQGQLRTLGMRADRQEVILFPSEESYVAYRRGTGLVRQNVPLPAAALGDVIGSRIYLVWLPTITTILRGPNGQPIPTQVGAGSVNVLARLHSWALLNAAAEGGRVPAWFRLGLEMQLTSLMDPTQNLELQDTLRPFAQAGGLLTPAQFEVVRAQGQEAPNVAEAQALAIMLYFYRQFGNGAVVETLQRVGARQSMDQALQATTEQNQLEFFGGWRDAFFGAQNFPNQG